MVLKADGTAKKYFRKSGGANYFYAVNAVNAEFEPGTLSVILGRSGGGKSTLLNMLAGILQPSEGRALFGDTDIYAMDDKELSHYRNAHIGVVPQSQSVLTNLTVKENVLLPAALYGDSAKAESYANELLETVGIADLADVSSSDLSGGEMRRVSIARALVMKPDVLLADEPTADLDDENTQKVFEIFRKIADNGTIVVIVTHETDAEQYADAVYRMNSGSLEKTCK